MTISILGCGWLGFPLGLQLQKQQYIVKGATTHQDKIDLLKNNGIEPFLIEVHEEGIQSPNDDPFWESDILFLNIPPGRRKGDVLTRHPKQIQVLIEKIVRHGIKWVIFASSTSVYNNDGGLVTEEDTDLHSTSSESGKALIISENMLLEEKSFDTTILRFGGLYGYDRHPVKYLAGRKNISKANKPINLIHQDDCIRIILDVIQKNVRNDIFNAVSDGHPPRKVFYSSAANHYGLPLPDFKDENCDENKIVSNEKLKKRLDYTFQYPNPIDH